MTPLRQRMIDAMVTRGFAARTQESYVEAIARLARHYQRSPALLGKDEVSAYLLDMVSKCHLSYSTMNQAACAARFLYFNGCWKALARRRFQTASGGLSTRADLLSSRGNTQ
ncbi:site-specific integrase [Rhodoferax sp.]|uniref:site-specific integrase n=1 Tax=Rhodoferax sp. TaxID=50421 RepID=UPI0019F65793|nr:site-specific integrase [Rhodoferax sp.]MBE0472960.1 phage integrase N-terminal SAM-like domain-containing protein [Rhodoferax sp.]